MVRFRWRRFGIHSPVAWLAALALVAVYAGLAIFSQPVASGNSEALDRPPGQTVTSNPGAVSAAFFNAQPALLVLSYVDGATDTLVKTIVNRGTVAVTVTGVEDSRPDWAGLVSIRGASASPISGPDGCCTSDEIAAASASEFHPLTLAPAQYGAIFVHIKMANCEYNSAGQYVVIDSIPVQYTVLGFQHVQEIGVGPYWYKSPDTCPRSGPARPAS